MPRPSPTSSAIPPDYAAARERLAHRARAGVIAVEGPDRAAFLQGQLTQDVRDLGPGDSRLTAGLTPKGKLLYFGQLVGEAERILLLLPEDAVPAVVACLSKYAALQKATVRDATSDYVRVALYGPGAEAIAPPAGGVRLPPEGELAGEILAPTAARAVILARLAEAGSMPVSEETAEVLRVEAGRPRLLLDADESNLPDEVGLQDAISTTKGCYVGQEVVARIRTYGRVNRRLVGLRFPAGAVPARTTFPDAAKAQLDLARVTSSVVSPRFGPIGLGLAFREVAQGAALSRVEDPGRIAVVCGLPFA